jgi:hypothetical protein
VRRLLPFLVAGILGPTSAFLASCGDRSGLIPSSNADRIKGDLDQVQSAIIEGNCDVAGRAAQQVAADVQALPATVDQRLQDRLNDGAANLQNQAQPQCEEGIATETTTTETTPTETTPTETAPTETTPPPPTETQPAPPTIPPVDTGDQGSIPPLGATGPDGAGDGTDTGGDIAPGASDRAAAGGSQETG